MFVFISGLSNRPILLFALLFLNRVRAQDLSLVARQKLAFAATLRLRHSLAERGTGFGTAVKEKESFFCSRARVKVCRKVQRTE
jgi:hypothetical protein